MSKKKIIVFIILLVNIGILVYSSVNIIKWNIDNKKTSEEVNEIKNKTDVETIKDDDSVKTIINDVPKEDPYWDYIKMDLINVNFNDLKSINSDVKGWIMVNGTNINYPFVQSKDNDYYLDHSFYKKYNQAGWVFMDYRNNAEDYDKNTILYGHSRVDKTMFGTLKDILDNDWYKNKDNYIIKLSTEKENTMWQVFSVYNILTTSDYLETTFRRDDEYQTFLDLITGRSIFDFNTKPSVQDKIITLSTCYKKTGKVVMHAKLIKVQKKEA